MQQVKNNTDHESEQAEALSAAIDGLNRGVILSDIQDAEVAELVSIVKLVKDASQVTGAVPQEVLDNIVKQASTNITRNKQKKRQAWRLAGISGAVAAVLVAAVLRLLPPVAPEQELAKAPQIAPSPVEEMAQNSVVLQAAPTIPSPAATITEQEPLIAAKPPILVPENKTTESTTELIVLAESQPSDAAAGETMLALADRVADAITIDAASKTIRQIYQQGTPHEIIVTQAPKQQNSSAAHSLPSQPKMRMAVAPSGELADAASKPPNKNKVTVIINNTEVTLEGAATEAELLSLAETLIEVNVTK